MKNTLQSKTFWFNVIVFIIGILALPEFVHVLPISWLSYDILGGAIGNEILRIFFTTQPVSMTAPIV